MPRIGGSNSAPGASGNEIVMRRTLAWPDKAATPITEPEEVALARLCAAELTGRPLGSVRCHRNA